jgi:hypothetical protein
MARRDRTAGWPVPGSDTTGVAGAQVRPHPGDHPLQAGDVLVDLMTVVAAEHDVEPGRARRTGV